MSRKDYELIAATMRASQPQDGPNTATAWVQWDRCVWKLADALRGTNPRFDSVRFIKACELKG